MSASSEAASLAAEPISVEARRAVEIKGNIYTMMSVLLHTTDLARVRGALATRVGQAPEFFHATPVIIDFSRVSIERHFDFKALFKLVRSEHLLPIAVRGIDDALRPVLQAAGVPIVEPAHQPADEAAAIAPAPDADPSPEAEPAAAASTIIDRPVRSGQQCYARGGDLILLASSSAGAELIADGNIHVYGTLRGKALCGVGGNQQTRIFCNALEADLVSVAGHYKILEDIPAAIRQRPVQIRLDEGQLLIEPL